MQHDPDCPRAATPSTAARKASVGPLPDPQQHRGQRRRQPSAVTPRSPVAISRRTSSTSWARTVSVVEVPPGSARVAAADRQQPGHRGRPDAVGLLVLVLVHRAERAAGLEDHRRELQPGDGLGGQRRRVLAHRGLRRAQRPRVGLAEAVADHDVRVLVTELGVVGQHDPRGRRDPGFVEQPDGVTTTVLRRHPVRSGRSQRAPSIATPVGRTPRAAPRRRCAPPTTASPRARCGTTSATATSSTPRSRARETNPDSSTSQG